MRQSQREVWLVLLSMPVVCCMVTQQDVMAELLNQHQLESDYGFFVFGDSTIADETKQRKWMPSDFNNFSLGEGSAGPSESVLKQASSVFISKEPIISEEECLALIEDAKVAIASGRRSTEEGSESTRASRTNSDLNEARLSQLPTRRPWLQKLLHEKVFPILESKFGVPAESMTLNDGLVLGYIAPSKSQPIHRDASLLTLQIALSPQELFTEGGTYIEGLHESLQVPMGHAMCHCSGTMHAGKGITSGERWVLVMFVLGRDEPQYARRLHSHGVSAMDDSNYPLAESSFQTGIEIAPTDQLLRLSLANCYLAQNKNSAARKQLRLAQSYKHCVRPFFLHANQLVVKSRPRAALRRLDMALERLGDRDLSPSAWNPMRALGWEIRVLAARCACLCAEKELVSSRSEGNGDMPWSRQHLPKAIERLHIALQFAPGHEPLMQMEARARQLMSMSQ
ncbi:unnamed protein product [Cylindrotheca closterium]|uniref:Fe2OG dioxygenase domain-containing protein n=1 Tax=Cylindrotheca closterium TaxID=2856 RepID=A0AAD2FSS4_9STRA|nr:unnamed protein product [Cylindrotheca closterium]